MVPVVLVGQMSQMSSPTKRRWIFASGVVVVAAAAVAVSAAGDGDDADAAPAQASLETAEVARTDLVRTETLEGELGFAESRPVINQAQGTLTAVTEEGSVVDRSGVLYRVDDQPVVLLLGELPSYRDLDTNAEGPDVKQLEENLVELGYGEDLTVDEEYTSATASAVEEFEEAVGLEADGVVTLGEVVFLPSSVRVGAAGAAIGTSAQPGQEVISVTIVDRVVTVDLENSDDLAVGDVVTVTLPDGSTLEGTVSAVEATETSSSTTGGGGGGAGGTTEETAAATATITVDPESVAEWDDAAVDVARETQRVDDVLAVPVTALVALAEGGYGVQTPDASVATGYRYVGVTVGMYTDDFVEISGDGIDEGTVVVVP